MTWLISILLGIHIINPNLNAEESFSFTTPCTISVEGCETLRILLPVKATHWNLHQGKGMNGLNPDTLSFSTVETTLTTLTIPDANGILPTAGTFYITAEPLICDTFRTQEPPHYAIQNTIQVSLRPDSSYIGYLYELINTPFIMAPRNTPNGFNQSDARMGTDCAGLALYGRRRLGETTAGYGGPRDLLQLLEPIDDNDYHNTNGIFIGQNGDTAQAPQRGDILHFRSQVSIFLEDKGIPGILDTEDLLIQSWFDGPHICRIEENGFTDYPVRLYRWR